MKSFSRPRISAPAESARRTSIFPQRAGLDYPSLSTGVAPPSLVTKRALDLGLAVVLILLASPLFLAAITAILITDGGPVIFRQRRVGFQGEEFLIFKFRTMRSGEAPPISGRRVFEKVEGDYRVTPVGGVLRRFSVDELPQLFNVLRGEMSLVGPRPLLLRDMKQFPGGKPMRRFDMKPGLTGLWQVSGRNLLSDEERIQLDLDYVERWNLWLDTEILLRTPLAVLSGRGAF